MTRLVFHLGDPKTGSTAIQTCLASDGCDAGELKLFYSAPINHIPLARTLLDKHGEPEFRARRFRKFARQLAASGADVAVVSAEMFERVDPQALDAAIREFLPEHGDSARLIAYVRPHADRLVSTFAERVKQGFPVADMTALFEKSLKRRRFHYLPRFARWREVFGERFSLRPMIRDHLEGRDVVRDFLDFALEGAPFRIRGAAIANESLSLQDLVLLREMQQILKPGARRASDLQTATGWALSRILAASPAPEATRPRLDRALAGRVQAAYAEDAAQLDAAFFRGEPMQAALAAAADTALAQPQSMRPEDHFAADELRDLRAWAGLLAEILNFDPDGWPRHFRQQQQQALNHAARQNRRAGGS